MNEAGWAPICCCRVRAVDDAFKLERFAVAKEFRKTGYGRLLIERVLSDYADKDVMLHAQLHATGFYEKFGFAKSGEIFMEEGAPHQEMCLSRPR